MTVDVDSLAWNDTHSSSDESRSLPGEWIQLLIHAGVQTSHGLVKAMAAGPSTLWTRKVKSQ